MKHSSDKSRQTLQNKSSSDATRLENFKVVTSNYTPDHNDLVLLDNSHKQKRKRKLGVLALSAASILGAKEYQNHNKEQTIKQLASCLQLDKSEFHTFGKSSIEVDPLIETEFKPHMKNWPRVEMLWGNQVQPKVLATDTGTPLTYQVATNSIESNYIVQMSSFGERSGHIKKVFKCITTNTAKKQTSVSDNFILSFPIEK